MAYYDPYNDGLRQPTGPMATYNTSTFEKIRRLARPAVGEIQQSNGFKLAGTGANIKNYPADLLRDSGMAKDAGLRANAIGAAKMGGRLLAAGNTLATLAQTGHDVATTSTEDYQKRLGIDEGSFWAKSDTPEAQFGKDLAVRGLGAVMDFGTRAADSIPFLNLGDRLRDNFADKQAPAPTAQPQAPAPQPQAAPKNVAGNGQLVVGGAFETDGISPELQARMEKNGIKFDGAPDTPKTQERRAQTSGDMVGAERMKALGDVRVVGNTGVYSQQKPGQSPEFSNVSPFKDAGEMVNYAQATNKGMSGLRAYGGKGGTVSTIQTGGVENYARQLATIRGLRESLGPAGGTVSVIPNPDKPGNSIIAKAMQAIDNLPRDMSPGHKAEAVAHLLGVANSAKQVDNMATRETARDSGGLSFRDLLEAKKFQYQVGRDQLQDGLAVDANNRNNRLAGATLAATGQNIEKGREDIANKQLESMFRKQDDKGNDVADTGSIGRFRTELAQAISTLANSGDKNDVARFGIPHKKADGSIGLRAREWDELTDNDKAALVRGFKFADHARKYADGGDRGGNFAEYMRGRKDAQGRVVFGSNGKTRAIVDAETLNSNGDTLNPLVAVNPFDKRKFGIYEPRDFSEFYK